MVLFTGLYVLVLTLRRYVSRKPGGKSYKLGTAVGPTFKLYRFDYYKHSGGKEDQLRVSKVHSASEHVQKEFSTTGTVLMFNGTYGFIQPSSLCSNAYVKAADGSTKLENIYVDIQALKDNKLVTLDRNQEVKVTFFRDGPRFFAKKIETIRR